MKKDIEKLEKRVIELEEVVFQHHKILLEIVKNQEGITKILEKAFG